ncbi:hypothetical protein ATCC90586_002433 [Pythium insidiosum]|nr:hypothetical protein ATCC90586_002433 [Pythium insidiosum]
MTVTFNVKDHYVTAREYDPDASKLLRAAYREWEATHPDDGFGFMMLSESLVYWTHFNVYFHPKQHRFLRKIQYGELGLDAWPDHEDPFTLPKLAIAQGDLAYLKKLHALVLSDPRLAEEPEMSFEDVTVAAIASGNIDIINWILTAVYPSQADEENLLEYAVYYGQTNVAKRLLATYPKSCQLPLAGDRFRLCSDGYCSQEILDWLDTVVTHDAHLQQYLSWPGIVDDIVAQGNADLLVFS